MSAAISPPGGTLDHDYNFNGPGAGRTVLANSGPVEITGTGSTACLRLDGVGMAHIEFLGLAADPAVSAAGDAKLIYSSATNTLRVSYNGAAYVDLGSGGGSLQDAYDFVAGGTGTSGDILLTSGQGPVRITNPNGILTGTVTVTNGLATVVGVGTLFLTEVYPNQNIRFASDLTYTTYQILSITDNLNMTLTAVYGGTTTAGDTATSLQQALTVANQTANYTAASFSGPIGGGAGGIVIENSFSRTAPLNANTAAIAYQAGISDYDAALTGVVDVTNGLATVVGVGTLFLTEIFAGDSIEFASDPGTIYTVLSVTDNLNLTLSAPYTGATTVGTAATAGDPASSGIIGYIVNTNKTRTGNLVGFATIGGNGAPSLWGLAVGSNLVLSALTFTPGSNEGNISLVAANGFGAGDAGRGVSFAAGAKGDSTVLDGTITGTGFSTTTWTQNAQTTGSPTLLTLVGGAHTTLAASTEATDVNVNLARTVEFATGALATQRAVRFQAPTYAFVGASTITTAATVAISGAPVAGANATITNAYALDVTGDTRITGKLTVTGLIDPSGLYLDEQGADQPAVANKGVLYTKDVATVTELFYRASDGTVTQLTPSSGGGGSLQDAYDFTPSGAITLSLAGGPLAITNPAATAQTAFTVTQSTAGQLAALFSGGSISAPGTGIGSERFGSGAVAAGGTTTIGNSATGGAFTNGTLVGYGATANATQEVVIGSSSSASGTGSIVIGYASVANTDGSIMIGELGGATGSGSIAIGRGSTTSDAGAISIGDATVASGAQSTAVGVASDATGLRALALGNGAQATATDAISLGLSTASANNTIAMGNTATASNSGAIAIGQSATASGADGIAIGNASTATATGAVALGAGADALHGPSVAIGVETFTTATNQVVIGSSTGLLNTIIFGSGVTNAVPATSTLRATSGSGGGSAGGGLLLSTGVSGDAATGSASLRLAVAVAGTGTVATPVLFVDSAEGSVLIGTATPVAGKKLVVSGDVKITGVLDPTALELATGTNLYIDSTDGSTAATAAVGHGRMVYNDTQKAWRASVDGGAYSNVITAATITSTAFVQNGNAFAGLATLGTTDANALSFITSNTARARILSGGAFLIGATTQVGSETFRHTGGTALLDNTATTALQVTQTGGGTPALVVDTTNTRVGVGAAPGAFTLDVTGIVRIVDNTATGLQLSRSSATARNWQINVSAGGAFEIQDLTGATTPFKIDTAGKVTIPGVLDPTALVLSGGTNLYIDSTDGTTATTAAVAHGRLIYNNTTKTFQVSADATAYASVVVAGSSPSLSAIVLGLGTAASPSLSFSGDSNTGVFSSGVDTVNLSTGGTSRLALTTTALTGTLPYVGPLGASATPTFTFDGDLNTGLLSPGADQVALSTGGTSRFTLSTTVMTTTLPLRGQDGTATAPSLSYSGDTNTGAYRVTTDTLGFSTAGVSRLQINASGALLLMGSTSGSVGFVPPAVAGSVTYTLPSADGTAGYVLSTNGAGTLSWQNTSTGGGTLDYAYDFGGAGAGRVIVADSGRVEIQNTAGGLYVEGVITGPGSGSESERFGNSSTASGDFTVAMGSGANADFNYSVAIGREAAVTGTSAIAIGRDATAASTGTAIGDLSVAAVGGTSYGVSATTTTNAIAIGFQPAGAATGSIAIGYQASTGATHDYSIALGYLGLTSAANQMAVGSQSVSVSDIRFGQGGAAAGSIGAVTITTTATTTASGGGNLTISGGAAPSGSGGNLILKSGTGSTNGDLSLAIGGTTIAQITTLGSFILQASGALATSATDGFTYLPTTAGTPTGTPTSVTGAAPIVYDTTNSRLFAYDGGWINVAQTPVFVKTGNYTVLSTDSPSTFTNEGAAGQVILTLPTAVAGLTITAYVQAAQNLRVLATGSETVRVGATVSGAAGYAEAATVGNALTLRAINATEWVAISNVGTWTVV